MALPTQSTERDRLEVQACVIDEHLEQQLQGVYNALQGLRDEMVNRQEVGFQERTTSRLKALTDAMSALTPPCSMFLHLIPVSGA